MNLLGAILYDPAVTVSKATSSLLAMTAIDTTNLRLAVTVPAHGKMRFVLRCAIVGATTVPFILLGVLNGATVVGRVNPVDFPGTASAATQSIQAVADFTVSGLTPGAASFDAAYAVQVIVASTNIKYGGPNTAAGANAWGGFSFEAWDPQPMTSGNQLAVDSSGRVDVGKIVGDATAPTNLKITTNDVGRGTANTGGTTTSIPTSAFTPSGAAADQFKGRVILFDSNTTTTALRGQQCTITSSTNAATPTFTVSALTTAPVSGDTFSVI